MNSELSESANFQHLCMEVVARVGIGRVGYLTGVVFDTSSEVGFGVDIGSGS